MTLAPDRFRIPFDTTPWVQIAAGMRAKIITGGGMQLRLVEFTPSFEEDGFCTSGHAGVVVEGALDIEYDGGSAHYRTGDGLLIPAGVEASPCRPGDRTKRARARLSPYA